MQADLHSSMRHIIDKSLVGDASLQEQQTLRDHLHDCAPCQQYAAYGSRAIAGLGGFSFAADPGLQATVLTSLTLRAQQLEAAQRSRRRMARICFVALLFTIVGSLGASHMGDLLAAVLHLQPAQTQIGLLAFWIVPSWCFALMLPVFLLLSARSTHKKDGPYEAS